MKRMLVFGPSLAILMFGVFLEGQQRPAAGMDATKSPVNWSGTQQVGVPDPAYQMTAYTLAVPNGWHFGGDLVRGQGCHGWGVDLNYKMESPDSLTAIIRLAPVQWHWDNDIWKDEHHLRQCEAVEISSAADFAINVLLPEVRPNAKIVSVIAPTAEQQRSLDDAGKAEMQMYIGWAQQAGGQPPQHVYVDAVTIRLESAINGQPVEELVTVTIDCHGGTNRNIFHPRYPPVTDLSCSSRPEHIIRAPKGQLDALLASPELKQLARSVQPNPEWWDRYTRDAQAQMARNRQATNQMIAQSWANFNAQQQANQNFYNQLNENGRIFNQNLQAQGIQFQAQMQNKYNAQQQDAHRWINFAGDKADYYNPTSGQTVALSNKFSRTFFSQDGTTALQTNGWNPNSAPGSGVWSESSQPH